jgi:hypothetical protein
MAQFLETQVRGAADKNNREYEFKISSSNISRNGNALPQYAGDMQAIYKFEADILHLHP